MGINMVKGDVAEALMILANNLQERRCEFPDLLAPTLSRFAADEQPAVRSLILHRLPYLQSKAFDLGWDLFHIAMRDAERLWDIAEPCLYYAYHNHFEVVRPLLARLRSEGVGKDLETWGRISALAGMARHVDFAKFLEDLNALDKTEAWNEAAPVWTKFENIQRHREHCLSGLEAGLNAAVTHAEAVAMQFGHLFQDKSAVISIPIDAGAVASIMLEGDPTSVLGLGLKAQVELNQHDFRGAKNTAETILSRRDDDLVALGVLSDPSSSWAMSKRPKKRLPA